MASSGSIWPIDGMDEAKLKEIVEKWDDEEFKKSASPDEQRLREKMLTICPMRSKPFKKEDLKYASGFAKKAITYLKSLTNDIRVQQGQDSILREGCQAIVDKYVADHDFIRDQSYLELVVELIDNGAKPEMISSILRKESSRIFKEIAKRPEFNFPEAVQRRRDKKCRRHLPIQLTRDYEKEGFPFPLVQRTKADREGRYFFHVKFQTPHYIAYVPQSLQNYIKPHHLYREDDTLAMKEAKRAVWGDVTYVEASTISEKYPNEYKTVYHKRDELFYQELKDNRGLDPGWLDRMIASEKRFIRALTATRAVFQKVELGLFLFVIVGVPLIAVFGSYLWALHSYPRITMIASLAYLIWDWKNTLIFIQNLPKDVREGSERIYRCIKKICDIASVCIKNAYQSTKKLKDA